MNMPPDGGKRRKAKTSAIFRKRVTANSSEDSRKRGQASASANGLGRSKGILIDIFEILEREYGPRRWWPVTAPGGTKPEYTGGPKSPLQRFEVAVGAVLTQNTAWANAARAVMRLNEAGVLSPEALCRMDEGELAALIRSSGYYNQKAKRLKILAAFFRDTTHVTRDRLLALTGIGPETADSIMLYAFGRLHFVIDAYTRRIFERVGILGEGDSYEEIRRRFEESLPGSIKIYQEYHALIVEHAKAVCRKKPLCIDCVISEKCEYGRKIPLRLDIPRN
jgi:endonuclease-3 related protein